MLTLFFNVVFVDVMFYDLPDHKSKRHKSKRHKNKRHPFYISDYEVVDMSKCDTSTRSTAANSCHGETVSYHQTEALAETHSYASSHKGQKGLLRIIYAAHYSVDGFKAAYQCEAAFRQILGLHLLLLMITAFTPFAISIKMMLITASFLSLIVELINTGIEASVDHTSTAQHPLAKIAKDVGSAGQFLALTLVFILWSMALFSLGH